MATKVFTVRHTKSKDVYFRALRLSDRYVYDWTGGIWRSAMKLATEPKAAATENTDFGDGVDSLYYAALNMASLNNGTPAADFIIQAVEDGAGTIGAVAFTGSGLNDATSGGTYTGAWNGSIRVQIDAEGTPDTFKWSRDGGATWNATGVAITGAAQTIEKGVTITFGATTGHTTGEYWDIAVDSGDTVIAESHVSVTSGDIQEDKVQGDLYLTLGHTIDAKAYANTAATQSTTAASQATAANGYAQTAATQATGANSNAGLAKTAADNAKTAADAAASAAGDAETAAEFCKNVQEGDVEIDTTGSPWKMKIKVKGTATVLVEKFLYKVNDVAVGQESDVIGKQLEDAL